MRLVADNGDQLGIKSVQEALRLAEEANVDLVEIAPLAVPPVCKLMDYGKFRYREQKKAHEAKLKQKQIQVKEIKFRPGTDEGDYKIKLGKLVQFLEEGDKAKVTLRFRGREMAHQEFGERLLQRVQKDLDAVGLVDAAGKTHWATGATASSTYGQTAPSFPAVSDTDRLSERERGRPARVRSLRVR